MSGVPEFWIWGCLERWMLVHSDFGWLDARMCRMLVVGKMDMRMFEYLNLRMFEVLGC